VKVKLDFVTNSSSSSFIIGEPLSTYKKDKKILVRVKTELNLRDLISTTFQTIEEFEKEYGYMKDGNQFEQLKWKEVEEVFANGGVIHIVSASDHSSNPLESKLCYNGLDNEDIEIPDWLTIIDGKGEY